MIHMDITETTKDKLETSETKIARIEAYFWWMLKREVERTSHNFHFAKFGLFGHQVTERRLTGIAGARGTCYPEAASGRGAECSSTST